MALGGLLGWMLSYSLNGIMYGAGVGLGFGAIHFVATGRAPTFPSK